MAAAPQARSKNTVSLPVKDRVRTLIEDAKARLDAGLIREAADIFGRVLLLDPRHRQAGRGLERARTLLAENERRLDAAFEEARRAMDAGENDRARQLLERVVREGSDAAAAMALLDRLDARRGRLDALDLRPPVTAGPEARAAGRRPAPRWRQVLVGVWTLVLVTLAVSLAFSWDRLVDTLVSTPTPTSAAIATAPAEPEVTAGEIAVSRAREMIARGDLATALVVLEEVSPTDAEYPFARRLRAQVVAALQPRHPR
jgi:Tfp pilus assembly protein PilF